MTVNCHAAPIGWSEVNIENADKKQVSDDIVNILVNQGWQIRSINDYQVIFRHDCNNPLTRALYGSKLNSVPEYRLTISFIQSGPNVRVTGQTIIVTNPHSSFESTTIYEMKEIQEDLNTVRVGFTGWNGYGFSTAEDRRDGCFVVDKVWPNSPAEKAGLISGDMISGINGKPAKDIWRNNFLQMLGDSGTPSMNFMIKRVGSESSVNIAWAFIPPTHATASISTGAIAAPAKPSEPEDISVEADWKQVVSWKGHGTKNTENFVVGSNNWRIRWSTAPATQGLGSFTITVCDPSGKTISTAANVSGFDKSSSYMKQGGEFYLTITSTQPYLITVEQKEVINQNAP